MYCYNNINLFNIKNIKYTKKGTGKVQGSFFTMIYIYFKKSKGGSFSNFLYLSDTTVLGA